MTTAVVNDFSNQYPPLRIKPNPDCHDRLIVIDYKLSTEQVYHGGASGNDVGKDLRRYPYVIFMLSKMLNLSEGKKMVR